VCSFGCSNKMEYKEFTSEQGWFTIQLPDNWDEFEDNEGTYLFYDAEKWKGNFRITPLRWDNKKKIDTVPELLAEELEEKSSKKATMVKIGDFDCVFYKDYFQEELEEVLTYNWTFGKDNTIFWVSYSTDKEREETESNNEALRVVENVIKSLQIK